ncbi:hypothetical protein SNEBB_003639 [Seison nebaliae]|nr:hypothetical protein SNEBB_003639 [Seison nebaliae]
MPEMINVKEQEELDEICSSQGFVRKDAKLGGNSELSLELFFCNIKTVRTIAFNFQNLTSLKIIGSAISSLEHIGKLEKLQDLWLCESEIEDVSHLSELVNLRKLYLYQNSIESIYYLTNLVNLEVLWLAENLLTTTTNFNRMPKLKELNLAANQISYISKELCLCKNLKYLNLAGNSLKSFKNTEWLKLLHNLKELYFYDHQYGGNPLTEQSNYIIYVLKYFPNIQKLDQFDLKNFGLLKKLISSMIVKKKNFYEMKSLTFRNLSLRRISALNEMLNFYRNGTHQQIKKFHLSLSSFCREYQNLNETKMNERENDSIYSDTDLRFDVQRTYEMGKGRLNYWNDRLLMIDKINRHLISKIHQLDELHLNLLKSEYEHIGLITINECHHNEVTFKAANDLLQTRFVINEKFFEEKNIIGIKLKKCYQISNSMLNREFQLNVYNYLENYHQLIKDNKMKVHSEITKTLLNFFDTYNYNTNNEKELKEEENGKINLPKFDYSFYSFRPRRIIMIFMNYFHILHNLLVITRRETDLNHTRIVNDDYSDIRQFLHPNIDYSDINENIRKFGSLFLNEERKQSINNIIEVTMENYRLKTILNFTVTNDMNDTIGNRIHLHISNNIRHLLKQKLIGIHQNSFVFILENKHSTNQIKKISLLDPITAINNLFNQNGITIPYQSNSSFNPQKSSSTDPPSKNNSNNNSSGDNMNILLNKTQRTNEEKTKHCRENLFNFFPPENALSYNQLILLELLDIVENGFDTNDGIMKNSYCKIEDIRSENLSCSPTYTTYRQFCDYENYLKKSYYRHCIDLMEKEEDVDYVRTTNSLMENFEITEKLLESRKKYEVSNDNVNNRRVDDSFIIMTKTFNGNVKYVEDSKSLNNTRWKYSGLSTKCSKKYPAEFSVAELVESHYFKSNSLTPEFILHYSFIYKDDSMIKATENILYKFVRSNILFDQLSHPKFIEENERLFKETALHEMELNYDLNLVKDMTSTAMQFNQTNVSTAYSSHMNDERLISVAEDEKIIPKIKYGDNDEISEDHRNMIIDRLYSVTQLTLMERNIDLFSATTYLKNLRFLNLSHNGLRTLKGFAHLLHLEYLNVDYNRIQTIKDFRVCGALNEFHVAYNCINNLEETVRHAQNFQHVKVIDLRYNEFYLVS